MEKYYDINIILTPEILDWLEDKCKEFTDRVHEDVSPSDVLYTYLNSDESTMQILWDWDEGKSNDPFWNDELNEHCTTTFLRETCTELYKMLNS